MANRLLIASSKTVKSSIVWHKVNLHVPNRADTLLINCSILEWSSTVCSDDDGMDPRLPLAGFIRTGGVKTSINCRMDITVLARFATTCLFSGVSMELMRVRLKHPNRTKMPCDISPKTPDK